MATSPKSFRRRSKADFFQKATEEYMRINGITEFDPDDVAEWMVETRQYEEQSYSVVRRCKQELTKALRAQHQIDPDGEDVRALLCVRHKNAQGLLSSRWSKLYESKPEHARLSGQQWRRGIRGEVLLHDRTFRSYNKFNIHGAQLTLFDHDYNKDIEEDSMSGEDYPETRPDDPDKPTT
jgi:hypothetical protein